MSMAKKIVGPRPCSRGTCGPYVLDCWHVGDPVEHESAIGYALGSYAQWAWKIGEALAPAPVSRRMARRRRAKSKRIRAEQKALLRR